MSSPNSAEKARGQALVGLEARQGNTAAARRPQIGLVDVNHSYLVLGALTDAQLVLVKERRRHLEQLEVPRRSAKEV